MTFQNVQIIGHFYSERSSTYTLDKIRLLFFRANEKCLLLTSLISINSAKMNKFLAISIEKRISYNDRQFLVDDEVSQVRRTRLRRRIVTPRLKFIHLSHLVHEFTSQKFDNGDLEIRTIRGIIKELSARASQSVYPISLVHQIRFNLDQLRLDDPLSLKRR